MAGCWINKLPFSCPQSHPMLTPLSPTWAARVAGGAGREVFLRATSPERTLGWGWRPPCSSGSPGLAGLGFGGMLPADKTKINLKGCQIGVMPVARGTGESWRLWVPGVQAGRPQGPFGPRTSLVPPFLQKRMQHARCVEKSLSFFLALALFPHRCGFFPWKPFQKDDGPSTRADTCLYVRGESRFEYGLPDLVSR